MLHELLVLSEEVKEAVNQQLPIVTLESTLLTHSFAYPENKETVQVVEQIIRTNGAIPAIIALHQGKIHIGIHDKLKEALAQEEKIIKASRRNLAFILSCKKTASTTVGATLYCTYLAGLPLFVTGGIGGIHYNVEERFDISADLIELYSTPVTIVCSGAKSILDLPKTLEALETHGVPVIGYRTSEFPAFYSHTSGIPLLHRLDNPKAIAKLMKYQNKLDLKNGIVIANPIPRETQPSEEKIVPILKQIQQEDNPLNGKTITPYLLQRLSELTEDQSLETNIQLIKNNALLATKIVLAYQQLR